MQRVMDVVALVLTAAVMVVSVRAIVPREGHHDMLDALKIDVPTMCAKSVTGQDRTHILGLLVSLRREVLIHQLQNCCSCYTQV
jgi:hypothetical protein